MTSMKRMRTHDTALTPLLKLVSTASPAAPAVMDPKSVSSPVATTTAVALPEMTFVPMKARSLQSVRFSKSSTGSGVFSMGSLSPVRDDWATKRSFASSTRTSAGIMSPADSLTMSPTTTSSSSISRSPPGWRTTVQVVVIMASSFSAALPLRVSCTKRSVPERITMTEMMITVVGSTSSGVPSNRESAGNSTSVQTDTRTNTVRMAVNGLTNASTRRRPNDLRFSWVTLFEPYSARARTTSSSPRPAIDEPVLRSTTSLPCRAA